MRNYKLVKEAEADIMKALHLKFFIVDLEDKELEDPIVVYTSSAIAVKNYLLRRYAAKYGEGNFKVKYTKNF